MNAFLLSIEDALKDLSAARDEAIAELSEDLKKEEWQLRFSIVSEAARWNELYHAHARNPFLYALTKICAALAGLETVNALYEEKTPEHQGAAPSLKLGKARAGMFGHGK